MGLSVHRHKAHPEVYHLENVPKQRTKARWDREELVLLTREELRAEAEGVKEMNKHLHSLFPSRLEREMVLRTRYGLSRGSSVTITMP